MDRIVKAVLVTVLAAHATASGGEVQPALVFRNVRIYDGARVIPRGTVVVKGGVIRSVTGKDTHPEGAKIIEGEGKTLLPGLIDAHVHIIGSEALTQAVVFGVTTELDMFTSHQVAAGLKRVESRGGSPNMADFRTAGTLLTPPGGHGTQYGLKIPTISKPENAQAFVDARIAEGSDYIKIIYALGKPSGVSKAVLAAAVKAAHKRKKLAVVHISRLNGAKDAVEAGADGLAHVFVSRAPDESFCRFMAQRGSFVICTLSVIESMSGVPGSAPLAASNEFAPYLSGATVAHLKGTFSSSKGLYDLARKNVRGLKAAGVTILAGTDAPNIGTAYGVSMHHEIELLTQAGLKPVEALAAATSAPARVFGLTDRGRIAPGLRADLLLVTGDPTTDIKATRRIAGVWKQGRKVDREAYAAKIKQENIAADTRRKAPPPKGSESGLVSDFEQPKPTAKFGFGWVISTDAFLGGKSKAKMEIVQGGAQGSKQALRITGEVAAGRIAWAGAMFYPGRQPMTPANLSARKKISFWAKGDGQTYAVMIYARSRGYFPADKTFVPGAKWKQFTFALSAFGGIDGSDITGVLFGRSPGPGKIQFLIDNVRFLTAER